MRLAVVFASAGLLLSTTASAQQPEISLQVAETSPASPAQLHKNDHLYLRIHYQTNVQMWVRPVYSSGGSRVNKGLTNGQWLLDPGGVRASGSTGLGAVSVGASALVVIVVAGVTLFAGFAWPVWGIVRWRGGWRIAAAIPAAALVLWTIKDVIDLVGDSTSHNLLPFEFIIGGFLILPYMLVVAIVRRVRTKGRTNG